MRVRKIILPVSAILSIALALAGCRTAKEPADQTAPTPPPTRPPAASTKPRLLLSCFLGTFGSWVDCRGSHLSLADTVDVEGIGSRSWLSGGHADSFRDGRWAGSTPLRTNGSWEAWDLLGRTGQASLLIDVGLRHDDDTSTTGGVLPLRAGASLALVLPSKESPDYAWVYAVTEAEASGAPGSPCLTCMCLDVSGLPRPAGAKVWSLRGVPKGASVTAAFSVPPASGTGPAAAVNFTATRNGDNDVTVSLEATSGSETRTAGGAIPVSDPYGRELRLEVGGAKVAIVFSICQDPGPPDVGTEEPHEESVNRALRLPSSHVTIDVKDAPLGDVLAHLSRQSGNARAPYEPWLANTRVTLAAKDAPYWEAFDGLCTVARLYSRVEFDGELGYRDEYREISACAGPAVLKLNTCVRQTGAALMQYYRGPKNSVVDKEAPPSLRFEFVSAVEDRLPLLDVKAYVMSVRAASGELLKPRYGPERMFWDPGEFRFGAGTMALEVPDTNPAARGPVTISGRLRLLFGIGEKEVRYRDILGPSPRSRVLGPFKVDLMKAERRGDRIWVTLHLNRDLPSAMTHEARVPGRYGLRLMSARSGACPGMDVEAVEGSVGMGGRTQESTWSISFGPLGATEGRWDLVFTAPERIVERTYPFTLKDVPLP